MSRDYNYEHIRGVIRRRGREDIFSTAFSLPLRKDVSVLHERKNEENIGGTLHLQSLRG